MSATLKQRLAFLLPLLAGVIGALLSLTGALQRPDNWFYDTIVSHQSYSQKADDPIIIEVDNRSLAELGRWPWPRELHARLIDQLQLARAVGMDIALSESTLSSPRPDEALAAAMRRNGKVVVPVFPETAGNGLDETRPIPILANAANRLGHTDFERDSDGVIRRSYLQAGLGSPDYPSFAKAVLDVARRLPAPALQSAHSGGDSWVRKDEVLVPFRSGVEPFQRLSYIDALTVATPETFRDRIVLIGATAAGLGDQHATPVSANASGMSGVLVNAFLLRGLQDDNLISPSNPWSVALAVLLLIALTDFALSRWGNRRSVVLYYPAAAIAIGIGSFALLASGLLWFPPTPAMLVLLAIGMLRFMARQASLQTLATTDGLTQLANRRHFDEVFQPAIERHRLSGQPLALVLMDIDHFKLYNDQYGHYAGDAVLKRVANVMRDCFQGKAALPARLGGEEFGVLLTGMDMPGAMEAAERFRHQLEALDLPHVGSPLNRVTCSVGVAARVPRKTDTPQSIYEDADGALYIAKRSGRNVVSPASS
ncbi:CHASE2 domain-containing protein [uncultured Aquitalea sp.]|uniref:CHASE2 domain-containing protein n=1 Tax=uncultured Aquitalea sp. TaxID=540272 RepID=UPI0025D95B08|nr:CHASE2 domain-containing protein [uncultured Aquitalea sp.]